MSDRLLQFFLADSQTKTEESTPNLLWKVVLRTGTWKLRPGPGGVKIHQPLKIYRDKAPKGHISMADLVKNFDAGAKENVTVPTVHADGTTSDSGFVRKLVIQDVPSEDGSNKTQSLLWAGLDITDSDIKKKIDEKSLVGVSGGILFDYERTEDAKKFNQVLSHVMVTNSPWINGTGGFQAKLPEGIAASEDPDLPVSELEFDAAAITDPPPAADPTSTDEPPDDGPATGAVVWKPNDGFAWIKGKLQRTLDENRRTLMGQFGDKAYELDWPYYGIDDVQGDGKAGKALVCSGYGSEKETWVVQYSFDDAGDVVIDGFPKWTPARQEWVAASEEQEPTAPSAVPRLEPLPSRGMGTPESGLRRAQRLRQERIGLSAARPTPQGGHRMSKLSDLLAAKGVELSDEEREAIRSEESEVERLRQEAKDRREETKQEKARAFLASLDGTPFDHPGTKKYIQSVLLSDDGEPAVAYVELSETGQRSQPVNKTATEIIEGLFASFPKDDKGKLTLSSQAPRLPDDPKPDVKPDGGDKDERKPAEKVAALDAEFAEQGLALSGAPTGGGS